MAIITNAETVEARQSGSIRKYLFRYTLDNGEVHIRRAWVSQAVDETTERNARGVMMLAELAEAEAARLIDG
jgi:hypothetical protein